MDHPSGRARRFYVSSTVLFVVFCVLWGLGPRIEPRSAAEFSVTKLISYLAGIFAWALMCSAYRMCERPRAENSLPAKE